MGERATGKKGLKKERDSGNKESIDRGKKTLQGICLRGKPIRRWLRWDSG